MLKSVVVLLTPNSLSVISTNFDVHSWVFWRFIINFFPSLQIINVYNQEYESAAAFWPDVHGRIIAALLVSQLLLMGLLSTKEAAQSTPLLITLPILTIWFHRFCKGRFEPAFVRYPLQVCLDVSAVKSPASLLCSIYYLNQTYGIASS